MKYETGLYPSDSCPHVSTPCFQTHKSWLNPPSAYNNLGKNVAIMRFTILYQISHIQATFSHSEPEGVNSGQVVPNNLERVVHPRWRNNLGPVGDDWDPQWKPKYVPWCLRVNICVRVEFGYQKGMEWLRIWPNLKCPNGSGNWPYPMFGWTLGFFCAMANAQINPSLWINH